jgi:glycerol-3-phosphate O-acyltransferase
MDTEVETEDHAPSAVAPRAHDVGAMSNSTAQHARSARARRRPLPEQGPSPAPAAHVLSREVVGDVAARVATRVIERARASGSRLDEAVLESLYAERRRLACVSSDRRSAHDQEYWDTLRRELLRARDDGSEGLLRSIVSRYAEEVAGDFNPRVYGTATRVLPRALGIIARAEAHGAGTLEGNIHVQGEVAALRALAARGTVILAPTHVSNVDSLVLGLVIYRLGLPPFAYGAGLNLYSNGVMGFFMNHLGAYTIDRQKTDPLYRETLKEFVTVLLERGQHNLLFPGGTRSRSGAIEARLKKGLLGTAPAAFRHALASGADRAPVFVVPCTLSYPLVLEAPTLIADFLRAEGGSRYLDAGGEFDSPRRWVAFLRGIARLDRGVYVRFSRPLDWLGNEVDADGVSRDRRGRAVAIDGYLRVGGRLVEDPARDAEYTRQLCARVIEAYRRDHVVLPSQLVAFVLFEKFRAQRVGAELLHSLRGPRFAVQVQELLPDIERARSDLGGLEARGAIHTAPGLTEVPPAEMLQQALETFQTYHGARLVERSGDELRIVDPELLFYYRNRLEGYGLLGARDILGSFTAGPRRWS